MLRRLLNEPLAGRLLPKRLLAAHQRWSGAVRLVGPGLATLGSTKACATVADGDLLERILEGLARRPGRELRVLEWGSGLSTLYYPRWLQSRGVVVAWIALEYDREFFRTYLEPSLRCQGARVIWSEQLEESSLRAGNSPGSSPGVTAIVFDKGTVSPWTRGRLADRTVDLDEYVQAPRSFGIRFDAVLVDGRKRRRCLEEAAALLAERGVVVLHDAERTDYHCAFAAFRSGRRIGDQFWIGAQYDADFEDILAPSP